MKNKYLFIGLIVSMVLVSCTNKERNFDLTYSVKKLQDHGWTISRDERDEDELRKITYILTAEYINKGVDLNVETIESYMSLSSPNASNVDGSDWAPPKLVQFITFSSIEDAEKYYLFFVNESKKDKQKEQYVPRDMYLRLNERIYIETNSKEASEIIKGITFYKI